MTVIGLVLGLGLILFGVAYTTPPDEPIAPVREMYFDEQDYNDAVAAYDKAQYEYDNIKMPDYEAKGPFQVNKFGESFVDVPSIAITVGGCFAALMVAFPLSVWAKFPTYVLMCFTPNRYDPQDYIAQIIDFAKEARVKGLLSLEDKLASTEDPFLKSSLMLVVDSVEPEKVHNLLEAELDKLDERHGVGKNFMDMGAAFAPGFGMIGTLIGLVNMLQDMSDPNSIGPAMAVALLTTLYGSFLANLIFSPMANKLSVRHNEEYLCLELICQGVEAIQAGENPKFIEEKLNLLVAQKKKKKGKGGGEDAA